MATCNQLTPLPCKGLKRGRRAGERLIWSFETPRYIVYILKSATAITDYIEVELSINKKRCSYYISCFCSKYA